jgi:phage minor structural protein
MNVLTVFNRQKQSVGAIQTSGNNTEAYEVAVTKRANSDYILTFQLPMTSSKYKLLEEEGLIECDGQKYVIKSRKRNRQGLGRNVTITCKHIFNRMMDIKVPYSSAVEESFGTNISTLTTILSTATNGVFTFQVMDVFPLKDVYKWGYSNVLKAFQDLVNLYGVEFVPDNYNIKLYSKINIDNGNQFRFTKNIIDDEFETNTNALVTRMTGLAKDSLTIIDLPASNLTAGELARLNVIPGAIVGGLIKVPYLISQYAASWATPDNPYFDGEFQNSDIDASTVAGKLLLLDEIRKRMTAQEIADIQIKINPADLWKTRTRDVRPTLWETVPIVDVEMELDNIQARIVELTEYPFDLGKNGSVTLANYLLRDENQIIAELNASKKDLERLLTNKKVNTSLFETFAKQAITDINSSKTEVKYDSRGIVLQDKVTVAKQVVMSAAGIYITTDGGLTTKAAILADKIVAESVYGILGDFVQLRANQIIVGSLGEKIADSLLASATNWNGKTTLITSGGVYTGTVQANQIVASTLSAISANLGTITAGSIFGAYINGTTIDGGTITGALIRTASSGSRTEFDNSGNYLTAYQDNNNFVRIQPNISGSPGISFTYGGLQKGQMTVDIGGNDFGFLSNVNAFISAYGFIKFNPIGSVVLIDNWDKIAAGTTSSSQTLQQALNSVTAKFK